MFAVPSNAARDVKDGCILRRDNVLDERETLATRLEEARICLLANMFVLDDRPYDRACNG